MRNTVCLTFPLNTRPAKRTSPLSQWEFNLCENTEFLAALSRALRKVRLNAINWY